MSVAAISIAGVEIPYESFTVNLSVDASNGAAQVVAYPDAGSEGDTFVIQESGGNIFNGRIYGKGMTATGAGILVGKDVMAIMQRRYQGEDRVYTSSAIPSPADDTDQEIVLNLFEAMGVPTDLTSIEGASTPIGILRELRIVSGEDLWQYIRLLDISVVPNFQTFSQGNGAVYRRQRTIGTPLITLGASDIIELTIDPGDISTIRNGCVVRGYAGTAAQPIGEYSVANALVGDTPQTDTIDSFFIETQAAADELAEWRVGQNNGILQRLTVRIPLNGTECLGGTARITSPLHGLSGHDVYVVDVTHSGDKSGQTTTLVGEWRA